MSHHAYSFAIPEDDFEVVDTFAHTLTIELGANYLGDGVTIQDGQGNPWRAWDGPVPWGSYGAVEEAVEAAGGRWMRRPDKLDDLVDHLGGTYA